MAIFGTKIKTKSDQITPNCTVLKISRGSMTPNLLSNAQHVASQHANSQI